MIVTSVIARPPGNLFSRKRWKIRFSRGIPITEMSLYNPATGVY